jgi:hypothetical protein
MRRRKGLLGLNKLKRKRKAEESRVDAEEMSLSKRKVKTDGKRTRRKSGNNGE